MGRGRLRRRLATLLVVLVGAAATGGLAAAAEAPIAEAGLDQTVDVNTTVYLDAGGSTDPDGSIAAVTWTVKAPDGTTRPTTCPNCTRTRFTPQVPGQYEATVAVTGEDGLTRNDTLYVAVRNVTSPSVEIVGPPEVPVGTEAGFRIAATRGDAPLRTAVLTVDGTNATRRSLVDDSNATVNRTFDATGTYRLRATVRDADGFTGHATRNVSVVAAGNDAGFVDVCGYTLVYAPRVDDMTRDCSDIFTGDLQYETSAGEEYWSDLDGDGEVSVNSENIRNTNGGYDERYSSSPSSNRLNNSPGDSLDHSPYGYPPYS